MSEKKEDDFNYNIKKIFKFIDEFNLKIDLLIDYLFPLIKEKYDIQLREYFGKRLKSIKPSFDYINCINAFKNFFSCQQNIINNDALKFTKKKCKKIIEFITLKISDVNFNIIHFLENLNIDGNVSFTLSVLT